MPTTHTDLAERLHALVRRCPELRDEIEDALGLVIQLEDQARYQSESVLALSESVKRQYRKKINALIKLEAIKARMKEAERRCDLVRQCEPSYLEGPPLPAPF